MKCKQKANNMKNEQNNKINIISHISIIIPKYKYNTIQNHTIFNTFYSVKFYLFIYSCQ